jgi:hypothetical protein
MADRSVCIHEAAHAAVALHLGLAVREVRVEGQLLTPKYCETLYGIPEGTPVPGTGCMLEDDCLEQDLEGVLVAMIAPSCIQTDDPAMDAYAEIETTLALVMGDKHGLDPDELLDRAHEAVIETEDEILRIADLLEERGVLRGEDL